MRPTTLLSLLAASLLWPATAQADPTLLWQVELESTSYGSAAVDDVDGDGELEVVFGTYFNDEQVWMLGAADGAIKLQVPSGGGPVDNSVTLADIDLDGEIEILWGNSATTLFHVMSPSGQDEWTYYTGEVLDAPEAVADLDGDGALEVILASCGSETSEGLRVLRGTDGQVVWKAAQSDCYQSAPLIFDVDGDGILDVVVSTWFNNKVRAFSGVDGALLWTFETTDQMYHAGSFGDLNGDDVPDVALGDMDGAFFAINGSDGTQLWSASLNEPSFFGPTAMADLDGDGSLEVIAAGTRVHALSSEGAPLWSSDYLSYVARGPVIADADGNETPDVIVATSEPAVRAFDGATGASLWTYELPEGCDPDFAPVVWDFSGDGLLDIFVVCGRGYYEPDMEANWGLALALKGEGKGTGWPSFSHDLHHSGNVHYPAGSAVNDPDWDPNPGSGGEGGGGVAGGGTGGAGQGGEVPSAAPDGSMDLDDPGGCGCRTASGGSRHGLAALGLLLTLVALRRRWRG
ncbi:MAG: VCBS repeat-containing protein [Deltaproteobacteria bacterium]|nr:VCBS repeat-containing protein [Deltaproteobacteria bacterium]